MEVNTAICKNPWCKATFKYEGENQPTCCPKCDSFNKELSGGVVWKDKTYEGSRFDGGAHRVSINVKKYIR
jgi:ribosomal protein L37AE/L43A